MPFLKQYLLLVLLLMLLDVRIRVLLELFVPLRTACRVVKIFLFRWCRVVALSNTEHQLFLERVIDAWITPQIVRHQQLIERHAEVVRTCQTLAHHLSRPGTSTRSSDRRKVAALDRLRTLAVFLIR